GGNRNAVRVLLDALEREGAAPDAILSLGFLGDLSAVAPLVALLDDEKLAARAAVALNTITGAQLHAMVFVPDKIDPDELTDEERAAFEKDGTVPMRGGRPFGNYERHPLRDKAGWRQWLDREKSRFSRDHRWRMGKPHGPSLLVECLKCVTTPFAVRTATYDELVIRYRLDVPFEADLPVRQQSRFLAKMDSWVAEHSSAFVDGGYYFAG